MRTVGKKVYLTKRIDFSAAHRLYDPQLSEAENVAIFGKCANRNGHGHNYALEVTVQGTPDPQTGMVINLVDLKKLMHELIIDLVDHKHLNHDVEFLHGVNPTAENLVIAFWEQLVPVFPTGLLSEIKLYETENNWAVYRGEE